ncbi:conserved hypothetical protein [Mycoplasmopsis pulmonis]|uniref:ICEF-II n=2 Tax=Mycoplasmopsis pulmonis TaxID=2107 RepID=Q98QH9_MYCPU|nr:conserved hypothetical protein [Mycoplasmopsis pulmonis]
MKLKKIIASSLFLPMSLLFFLSSNTSTIAQEKNITQVFKKNSLENFDEYRKNNDEEIGEKTLSIVSKFIETKNLNIYKSDFEKINYIVNIDNSNENFSLGNNNSQIENWTNLNVKTNDIDKLNSVKFFFNDKSSQSWDFIEEITNIKQRIEKIKSDLSQKYNDNHFSVSIKKLDFYIDYKSPKNDSLFLNEFRKKVDVILEIKRNVFYKKEINSQIQKIVKDFDKLNFEIFTSSSLLFWKENVNLDLLHNEIYKKIQALDFNKNKFEIKYQILSDDLISSDVKFLLLFRGEYFNVQNIIDLGIKRVKISRSDINSQSPIKQRLLIYYKNNVYKNFDGKNGFEKEVPQFIHEEREISNEYGGHWLVNQFPRMAFISSDQNNEVIYVDDIAIDNIDNLFFFDLEHQQRKKKTTKITIKTKDTNKTLYEIIYSKELKDSAIKARWFNWDPINNLEHKKLVDKHNENGKVNPKYNPRINPHNGLEEKIFWLEHEKLNHLSPNFKKVFPNIKEGAFVKVSISQKAYSIDLPYPENSLTLKKYFWNLSNNDFSQEELITIKDNNNSFSKSGNFLLELKNTNYFSNYNLISVGYSNLKHLNELIDKKILVPVEKSIAGNILKNYLLKNFNFEESISSLSYEEIVQNWKLLNVNLIEFLNIKNNKYNKKIFDIENKMDSLSTYVDNKNKLISLLDEEEFLKINSFKNTKNFVEIDYQYDHPNYDLTFEKKSIFYKDKINKKQITININKERIIEINSLIKDGKKINSNIANLIFDSTDKEKIDLKINISRKEKDYLVEYLFHVKKDYQDYFYLSYSDVYHKFILEDNAKSNSFLSSKNFNQQIFNIIFLEIADLNLNGETNFEKIKNQILSHLEKQVNGSTNFDKEKFLVLNNENLKLANKVFLKNEIPEKIELTLIVNGENENYIKYFRLYNQIESTIFPTIDDLEKIEEFDLEITSKNIVEFRENLILEISKKLSPYKLYINEHYILEDLDKQISQIPHNNKYEFDIKVIPKNNYLKNNKVIKVKLENHEPIRLDLKYINMAPIELQASDYEELLIELITKVDQEFKKLNLEYGYDYKIENLFNIDLINNLLRKSESVKNIQRFTIVSNSHKSLGSTSINLINLNKNDFKEITEIPIGKQNQIQANLLKEKSKKSSSDLIYLIPVVFVVIIAIGGLIWFFKNKQNRRIK